MHIVHCTTMSLLVLKLSQTSISMHCDIVHSAVHCVAQIHESEKFKEVFECLHLLTEYSEQTFKQTAEQYDISELWI